ncbi:hypothetical protein HNQ34_002212 [Anoxybacillus tepidamans]|uniref:Uncharacterized protein n=1 Tax=Anoxybacteroides tepidamans TaxID=265948 RepID=A0A7W8IR23_9BACL|nr:hypothetical protein [Anoxybacillus tepidamans]
MSQPAKTFLQNENMAPKKKGRIGSYWNPEDPVFWEKEGKKHARRNLWISVPTFLPLSFGKFGRSSLQG